MATAGDLPQTTAKVTHDTQSDNTFNHRMRGSPKAVQQKCKLLTQHRDEKMMAEFMATVVAAKGQYADAFLDSCTRSVGTEDMDGEKGAWLPWKLAAEKEGLAELEEMVRLKTVELRPHPKLVGSKTILYPNNQQVRYTEDVFSSKRLRTTNHTQNDTTKADEKKAEAFEQEFTQWPRDASSSSGVAPTRQGQNTPTPPQPSQCHEDKQAIANIRKAHGLWDRARRDFNGLAVKSSRHANTAGCTFEKDLITYINDGTSIDAAMMEVETSYMEKGQLSQAQRDEGESLASRLMATIKMGQKRAVALKPWFNV